MSIWNIFKWQCQVLSATKCVQYFTMLGIIISITAVIALVSLMSGMTSEITEHLKKWVLNQSMFQFKTNSATKEVKPEEMEQLAGIPILLKISHRQFNACIYKKQ